MGFIYLPHAAHPAHPALLLPASGLRWDRRGVPPKLPGHPVCPFSAKKAILSPQAWSASPVLAEWHKRPGTNPPDGPLCMVPGNLWLDSRL